MSNTYGNIKIDIQSEEEQLRIASYWTPARKWNARPIELPVLSPEQFRRLLRKKNDSPAGISGGHPRVLPQHQPRVAGSGLGAPQPADVSQRPFWNGGKLFFTTPEGDRVGSAEFVAANNMVLTAAHCVMDPVTSNWYTNILFSRGFDNGGGQSVSFEAKGVLSGWYENGTPNHAYDYAFLRSAAVSGAGFLGLAAQIPYAQFTAIGYPDNYGGKQYMYEVDGSRGSNIAGVVQMVGNPMGSGSSGGAWIGNLSNQYDPNANIACGLNSFRTQDPQSMFGPLFDDSTFILFNDVANSGE